MSPVRQALTPRRALYRIARLPDPLAWLPWELAGGGRFDDPQRRFRALYAAAQRQGAFVETLARFRPSIESLTHTGMAPLRGPISRRAGTKRAASPNCGSCQDSDGWIYGLSDLDLSSVAGPRRSFTQAIARWSHEHAYAGAAYPSRLDGRLTLWAIFEGAALEPVGPPEPIAPDDPDLRAVARLFGLSV